MKSRNKKQQLYYVEEVREQRADAFAKITLSVVAILVGLISAGAASFLYSAIPSNRKSVATDLRQRLEALEKQVEDLDSQVTSISYGYNNSTPSGDFILLNSKISKLEQQQELISQTILLDADKAITSKLLASEQKQLERILLDISEDQKKLNEKYDSLLTNVLAIPLIGTCLALVSGFIFFLFGRQRRR